MKAALEGRQPLGAVPIWELEFHAWDSASSRHVILGKEFGALSQNGQERALHSNAEIILAIAEQFQFAAITLPGSYWEIAPGVPAYNWLPEDAILRQIRVFQERQADLLLVALTGGVIGIPGAENYLEFSYKLFDAPDEIEEQARACFAKALERTKKLRDAGGEVFCCPADLADNHGSFFNPEQMDRFVLPFLRKLARETRNMQAYTILHSDGDLNACLEDIADSGIYALQGIDPVAGMDIRKVKKQVGDRLCLCGNVDCGLLVIGTPEQVYQAACDELTQCKEGGGLVLGASNAVQQEIPIANYRMITEAWKKYGQY